MENDPLVKLLNLDPKRPVFSQLLYGIIGASSGFGGAVLKNVYLRRPFYAGIHQHLIAAAVLGYACHQLEKVATRRYTDRDAIIRHYIELHPEDFPPQEKKLYRDIMRPWFPVR